MFLKGCSLRCPWCSNPENLVNHPEPYIKDGIEGIYGKYYTPDELLKEVIKDKGFYDGNLKQADWNITDALEIEHLPGGVSFSGGEALLQIKAIQPLLESLHEQGIHTAVETCLYVPEENVRLAIGHLDFFYADVKILDRERALDIEHGNLDLYLNNLDILLSSGKPVVIRIPVIGGFTDDAENRKRIYSLMEKNKSRILKIELIKEHNLGESKYRSLNMQLPAYNGVSDELMEQYKHELELLGIPIEVCKI